MSAIQIFDRPLCCSTGVCGPSVDPTLPRFAADLEWLKAQGHEVSRFNLAQQPAAFVESAPVQQLLATQGTDCLPIVMIDGRVASCGDYPTRERFVEWIGGGAGGEALPVVGAGTCCQGGRCC